MASLVPMDVGGLTVYVEAAERAPLPGRTEIVEAGAEDVAERAMETASALTESIRGLCGRIVGSLREVSGATRPDRATVEFGLNVSAEGNVYVVKGSAQASITITAEWEFDPRDGGGSL